MQVPFKEELMNELRFVMKCHGNTKQIRRRKESGDGSQRTIASRSRSQSGSPGRDMPSDAYGFRPSLKNLRKEDLNQIGFNQI